MSSKKIIPLNQKRVTQMTDFVRDPVPDDYQKKGIVAVLENNKYNVIVQKATCPWMSLPTPDGKSIPMEILHLLIVRKDKGCIEIPYKEKQKIKEMICGPNVEAAELFPAVHREVKDIADYHTHLWVFPPNVDMPFGLFPQQQMEKKKVSDIFIRKDDLEVYVVNGDLMTEVFASEEEAIRSYVENDEDRPDGSVVMLDVAPELDEEGVYWSDVAKKKVSNAISSAEVFSENPDEVNSLGIVVSVLLDRIKLQNESDAVEKQAGDELEKMREELRKG